MLSCTGTSLFFKRSATEKRERNRDWEQDRSGATSTLTLDLKTSISLYQVICTVFFSQNLTWLLSFVEPIVKKRKKCQKTPPPTPLICIFWQAYIWSLPVYTAGLSLFSISDFLTLLRNQLSLETQLQTDWRLKKQREKLKKQREKQRAYICLI